MKSTFDKEGLKELIPQRPPIDMIDTCECPAPGMCRSFFTPAQGCIFLSGGNMLDVGIIETMAQTVAAMVDYGRLAAGLPVTLGYIGEVRKFKALRTVHEGEQIETVSTALATAGEVTLTSVESRVGGELVASCQMKIFLDLDKEMQC